MAYPANTNGSAAGNSSDVFLILYHYVFWLAFFLTL